MTDREQRSSDVFGAQAFSPAEIAARVDAVGVTKARLPARATFLLGMLAGAFIGLGALYYTLVVSDAALSFGVARVLGGVVFSLGLVLVVIAGAELFTGNNLLVMAWADRKITTRELLRNWSLVYVANALGAFGLALLVQLSGHVALNGGAVGATYVKIAHEKLALGFGEAFFRGVLCNVLVCLAVWLGFAGKSVVDKIVAVVFPISAFVAAGFEHSIANMYFVPLALMIEGAHGEVWLRFAWSLVPVTLGNVVGGGVLVAAVYHLIYGRASRTG